MRLAPGLMFASAIAGGAFAASRLLPFVVGEVVLALGLGLLIGNTIPKSNQLTPGMSFATKRLLRIGIALLGVNVSLSVVASVSYVAALVALLLLVFVSVTVWFSLKLVGIGPRLGALITVGTAICGNSAIIAAAPLLEADEREISVAIGTITLFGLAAVFIYPAVGHGLALPDSVFGFWAGATVHDTSQVVATGAAYSPVARDIAVTVKLIRNFMIVPVLLILAVRAARNRDVTSSLTRIVVRGVPLFALGFLAFVGLRTSGVLDEMIITGLSMISHILIVVALASLGFSTRFSTLRLERKALATGVLASTAISVIGLLVLTALDPLASS